jgi:heme-degrading monooxygenase HmoA
LAADVHREASVRIHEAVKVPSWNTGTMITEHALLPVTPGREHDFEVAFGRARGIISSMPGFRSLRLSRSMESPCTYLLLVQWDRLEVHTVGFRESALYQEWKQLLHRFYQPFPVVEHFQEVFAD